MENQSLDETLSSLQKSNVGILRGLSAIGSVLEKMDTRLQKQEEKEEADEEAKKKEEEEEVAATHAAELKMAIVKDLLVALKQEYSGQLLDLAGDTPSPVREETAWPMSSNPAGEDQEKTVKPRMSTSEKQKPIQAQEKWEPALSQVGKKPKAVTYGRKGPYLPLRDEDVTEEDAEVVDEVDDEVDENGNREAAEYPMEEDEFKEHPYVKSLLAKIGTLEKSLSAMANLRKSIPQLVEDETKKKLQKMGYREEKLLRPRRVELALPTEEPLKLEKADDLKDAVRELSKKSYGELRRMQYEAGVGIFAGLNTGSQADWSHYGDEDEAKK